MNKLKIAIIVIISALIVAISFLLYNKYSEKDYISSEYKFSTVYSSEKGYTNNHQIIVSGDNLYLATLEGIEKIGTDGKSLWSKSYHFNELLVISAGNYLSAIDISEKKAFIFNESGLQGEITCANEIVYGAINDRGYLALIIDDDDSQSIEIYDKTGEKVAERVTAFNSSGYPVFVSLNSKTGKAVSSHLTLKNSKVESVVSFFDFSGNGKNLSDRIFGYKTYEDNVISNAFFLSSDTVALIGDKAIYFYNFDDELNFVAEQKFENEPQEIFKYGNKIVISYFTEPGNYVESENKVVIYNNKGEINAKIDNPYQKRVDVDDENIYLLKDNTVESYVLNNKKWSSNFAKNVKGIKKIDKKHFLLIYDDNFEVLKTSGF